MAFIGNSDVETHLPDRLRAPDTASELLIAKLVLDDIAAFQATQKGKKREDAPLSDEAIAFELQASSITSFVSHVQDYQFASSIDRAIETDSDQLRALAYLSQAERDDHMAAAALERGEELPQQTMWQRMMQTRGGFAQPARERRFTQHETLGGTSETDEEDITSALEDVHIDLRDSLVSVRLISSRSLPCKI